VECGEQVSYEWLRIRCHCSSEYRSNDCSIRYQNNVLWLKKYDFMEDDYEVKSACFEDGRLNHFLFSHLYSFDILRFASVNHPIVVVEAPQRTMLTQKEKNTSRMPMLQTLLTSNVPAVCFVNAAICALVGGTMNEYSDTFDPATTRIVITLGQKRPEFKHRDSHHDTALGLTSCLSASSVVVVNNRVVGSTLVQFKREFTPQGTERNGTEHGPEFTNLLVADDEGKTEDTTSGASSVSCTTYNGPRSRCGIYPSLHDGRVG
jgi:hypothetical protein